MAGSELLLCDLIPESHFFYRKFLL